MAVQAIKGVPGGLMIDGQPKVLTETYEGWKWDTVIIHNGNAAVAAGQAFIFFRDLDNKDLIDTNITQPRRIGRGESMEIKTIGIHVSTRSPSGLVTDIDAGDFEWALTRLYLLIRINKKDVVEGALQFFPAGSGMAGSTQEANGKVLANGVPSLAALRPLYKPVDVNSDHDLEGTITHYAATWIGAGLYVAFTAALGTAGSGIPVRLIFGGKVSSGITRG